MNPMIFSFWGQYVVTTAAINYSQKFQVANEYTQYYSNHT